MAPIEMRERAVAITWSIVNCLANRSTTKAAHNLAGTESGPRAA